jgi:hypothetical protein
VLKGSYRARVLISWNSRRSGHDDIHVQTNQLGCQAAKSVIISISKT